MKNPIKSLIVATLLAFVAVSSHAVPMLQLGVWDPYKEQYTGFYDKTTDTTEFTGNNAVLRALLTTSSASNLNLSYFISAALLPATKEKGDYGSFSFDGTAIDVTADMTYGTPPADSAYPDLPSHGVFPTFYKEFGIKFLADNKTKTYNVETGTYCKDSLSYFADFAVDVSKLNADFAIHFDLYDTFSCTTNKGKTVYGIKFAPFSHDAEGQGTAPPVPEPATMVLLGVGLAGLAASRAYSKRKSS